MGFRSIWAKFARQQQRLNDQMRDEFRDLFPDDQLDTTIANIDRAVRRLMELEWREIAGKCSDSGTNKQFDPSGLVNYLTKHLAELTGAITMELAACIALLFIPGGVIVDIAWLVISVAGGAYVAGKTPARIGLAKREARVRLRTQRRTLVDKTSRHFIEINNSMSKTIIGREEETESAKAKAREKVLATAERWRTAMSCTRRLTAACCDFAGADA